MNPMPGDDTNDAMPDDAQEPTVDTHSGMPNSSSAMPDTHSTPPMGGGMPPATPPSPMMHDASGNASNMPMDGTTHADDADANAPVQVPGPDEMQDDHSDDTHVA